MSIDKIDGVNWVQREIPVAGGGTIQLQGLTVRALRRALEDRDPDSLVCYMAEQTEESRKVDLLIGVVAGLGQTEVGCVFMFGPEAVKAIKEKEAGETL